jgi:type IV pilus assembly protein PilY1
LTNVCSANLGLARSYAMPLFCVTPTSTIVTGGGLPPGPVVGVVSVTYTKNNVELTKLKSFVIGGPNSKGSAIEAGEPPPPPPGPRKRRYWYQEVNR